MKTQVFLLTQINSHRCALCVTWTHQLSRLSQRSLSVFVPAASLLQLVRPSLHSVSLNELPFHGGFYPVSTPITAIRHRWSSFCTWPTYLPLSPESFSRCRLRWTTPPSPQPSLQLQICWTCLIIKCWKYNPHERRCSPGWSVCVCVRVLARHTLKLTSKVHFELQTRPNDQIHTKHVKNSRLGEYSLKHSLYLKVNENSWEKIVCQFVVLVTDWCFINVTQRTKCKEKITHSS